MNRCLISLLILLISGTCAGAADSGSPLFTQVFSPQEFAGRRGKVMEAIGPNAVAVVKSAHQPDGILRFRQSNSFFYLTGVEVPGAYLIIDAKRREAILFLPPKSESRERSEGPLLAPGEEAKKLTGIDRVFETGMVTRFLLWLAGNREAVYVDLEPQEVMAQTRDSARGANAARLDDPWDGRASQEAHFVTLLRQRAPNVNIKNLSPILDEMRLIKSQEEIAVLRKAAELAGLTIVEAMRSTQPGQYEYELKAVGDFIFQRHGAQGIAYHAIVASGPNSIIGHYNSLQRQMRSGELVLMDYAPDYHYYVSDVTRMWPVDGIFSRQQRELYTFYLKCYKALMGAIRPNVRVRAILKEAVEQMEAVRRKTEFQTDKHRLAAEKFISEYRNSSEQWGMLGHWVGMAVHDVGRPAEVLKPGMVLSIEPALFVPEVNLMIRLEDTILVTETGIENLSRVAPVEIEAIENLMKEQGVLESYPRSVRHDAVRPRTPVPSN